MPLGTVFANPVTYNIIVLGGVACYNSGWGCYSNKSLLIHYTIDIILGDVACYNSGWG